MTDGMILARQEEEEAPSGDANFRKDIDLGLAVGTQLEGLMEEGLGLSLDQQITALTEEGLGLSQSTFAEGTVLPPQQAGLSAATAPATMTTDEGVGFSAEQASAVLMREQEAGVGVNTVTSGTVEKQQGIGVAAGNILVMNNLPDQDPGIKQQQIFTYVGTKYAATITNSGWTNPNNATGAPNGSNATVSGSLISGVDATLDCVHDAVGTKDPLDIDKVELRFYASQTGTLLGNGDLRFYWRIGAGAWQLLAQYQNDVNFLTNPDVHDVTGSVTDWDDIRDIETRVRAIYGLGDVLISAACDAVTKYIEGSLID